MEKQELVDVFAARAADAANIHPTYSKGGVYEGMAGTGKTRIDSVLCNPLASVLVYAAELKWDLGQKFDHACLAIKLNLPAMTQTVERFMPVAPICTDDFFFDPSPQGV